MKTVQALTLICCLGASFPICAQIRRSAPAPAPPSTATEVNFDQDELLAEQMSGWRLTSSILVGSTLGFGLGHALQGRYGDRGWLTLTELGTLIVIGAGFLECDGPMNYLFWKSTGGTIPRDQNGCSLIRAGSLLFVGLRIFEFVDLLRFLPTKRRGGLPGLRIDPVARKSGEGIAWGLELSIALK